MSETAILADPLSVIEGLTLELASLERQFSDRKIPKEQYDASSTQLKIRISNAESIAYVRARTNPALAEKLRARNYLDSTVQQVCYHFVSGSKQPLGPTFEADRIPRYFIEPERGVKLSVERALLQRLVYIGILVTSLFERIFVCPKCGTPTNVYARVKCTRCSSIDININRLMEHLPCGTVHEERAFKAENSMLCPTCKKILQNPTEHRVLGTVCSCNKCKAHFEDPSQSFFCRKCEVDFNLTTGIITDVYTYHINDKIIEEARTQTGLPIIQKALRQDGFEVEMPGRIEGGARQFAIVARKAQKRVAMDIGSNETEVDIEPVLQLFVKALDARPDLSVFVAIPQLSKRGRDVATMHDIRVIEGSSPLEVAHRILEMLKAEPIFIQGQTGTDDSKQKP